MTQASIAVTPLTSALGAEIEGVDLSRPLANRCVGLCGAALPFDLLMLTNGRPQPRYDANRLEHEFVAIDVADSDNDEQHRKHSHQPLHV